MNVKRKILTDLPRIKSGANENKVDWKKAIGMTIHVLYNDENYYLKILDYRKDDKSYYIYIKYNNKISKILSSNFHKCKFGKVFSKINTDFKYKINDVVELKTGTSKVVDKFRKKNCRHYKMRCHICNCEFTISEYNININHGCPVCLSQKIVKGINDIATTHPHLVKYFVNKEDAYKYSHGSHKEVKFKCDKCGNIKTMKISTFVSYGLACPKCSDGISYPEKFIYSMLSQLNLKFDRQFLIKLNDKKYFFDYLINDKKIIIEVDGKQHFESCYWSHVKDQQMNDNLKNSIAKEMGYSIIRIDCRKSSKVYIKEKVTKSQLNQILNLDDVNWNKCDADATQSLIKEICEYKNINGDKNLRDIGNRFNLHPHTISRYLQQGNRMGLCEFDGMKEKKKSASIQGKSNGKKILCINTNEIFESAKQCSENSLGKFGVQLSRSKISLVCNGKRKHHHGYKFKFIE